MQGHRLYSSKSKEKDFKKNNKKQMFLEFPLDHPSQPTYLFYHFPTIPLILPKL